MVDGRSIHLRKRDAGGAVLTRKPGYAEPAKLSSSICNIAFLSLCYVQPSIASPLHLDLALQQRATTYGWGEHNCGDVGKPRPCTEDAATASGEAFQPHSVPSAALPAPKHKRLRPSIIWLRLKDVPDAPCVEVRLNDKANPRWIGQRGLDLSPAAVRQLTQRMPTPHWSGEVELCKPIQSMP